MFSSMRTRRIKYARGLIERSRTVLSLLALPLLISCADDGDSTDLQSKRLVPTNGPTPSVSPLHQALLDRLQRRDSDYDGRTDVEEYGEGGDPFDPTSRRAALLARWRFNDSSLVGERGERPVRRVGARAVEDPAGGSALWLDPESEGAAINYRVQELSGKPNINLREGTLRFRFRPDWSSGEGPGNIATLLAVGVWNDETTYPFWGLIFNGSGDKIHFFSNGAGERNHMLEGNVHLEKGRWVTIHLAYSPARCAIWLDRELIAESDLEAPPTILALDIANRDGFDLGANRYGGHPARGAIDDLELYNTAFTPEQLPTISDWGLYARYDAESESARLEAARIPGVIYAIDRATFGPSGRSTFETIVSEFPGGVFVDTSAPPEKRVIYRASALAEGSESTTVRERSLVTSADVPAQRGLLALLVDESLQNALRSSIDDYLTRAVADGWRIWSTAVNESESSHRDLVERIHRAQASMEPQTEDHSQQVVAVTLLGQLESLAAEISQLAPPEEPWAVSIIDLAPTPANIDEFEPLATAYFDKLSRIPEGALSFPERVLRDPEWDADAAMIRSRPQAHELAISLYGVDASRVDRGARPPLTYMMTTRALSEIETMKWTPPSGSQTRPQIGILLGDNFEVQPNDETYRRIIKALARADSYVAAVSATSGRLNFGLIAEGRSLAAARALAADEIAAAEGSDRGSTQPIVGDPTFRLFAKTAPEDFLATSRENGIQLSWDSSTQDCLIERSDDGLEGRFIPVYSGTLESGAWLDPHGANDSIYRVRYRAANPYGPGPRSLLSYGALASPTRE